MTQHEGSCHCGQISLILRETPGDAAECNCSLCRRTGALWHYSTPAMVSVFGEGAAYVQGDRTLATWHCRTCGCITHWTALDPAYKRMGVNLRLFDPNLWEKLPRRLIDGASY